MDDLKDLFAEFKARFNNPFIGSFIIAWLIFNWYIWLALLFYTPQELLLDGFKSYRQAIQHEVNFCNNLVKPLISALLYVIAMPHFRGWIKSYQAKVSVKSENDVLEANNNIITFKTLIESKDKIISEKDFELITIKTELDSVNSELNATKENLTSISDIKTSLQEDYKRNALLNSETFLNGDWEVNFSSDDANPHFVRWEINGNIVKTNGEKLSIVNRIGHDNCIWLKLLHESSFSYDIFTFDVINTNRLEGTQNLNTPVKLIRGIN